MRIRLLIIVLTLALAVGIRAQSDLPPIIVDQFAADTPQVVTWIAPSGDVTPIGNPLYQWSAVPGVNSYQIYVGANDSGNYTPGKFLGTIPASVCDENSLCSVDLTAQTNELPGGTAWLSTGRHAVFINADGTWEGPFEFTVVTSEPDPVTFGAATGTINGTPAINFTLENNAIYAAFFQFYIAPALEITNATLPGVTQWVSRQDACGAWDSETCSWTPNINWQNGTRYSVYAQAWGAGGLSVGGVGDTGWSTTDINIGGPPPAVPSNVDFGLVSFVPTVTWDDDPNTTSYTVAVLFPNAYVFVDSFDKVEADCDGTTCRFQIIPPNDVQVIPGQYTIYVQPLGPGGTAPGGILNLGWFEIYTFNI